VKFYLAASYARRREMQGIAAALEAFGPQVTSRWVRGDHELDDGLTNEAKAGLNARFGGEDIEDIHAADVVVSFTEPPQSAYARGGRHVEFGVAVASGKRLIVIGYRENVFHWLPQIEFYERWEDIIRTLTN
jgi:hypothetical protein